MEPANVQLPESIDWRKNGSVTDVKNQRRCGSCWSFSTTGSLEGQNYRKTGKLISLSEQNLVDCDHANHGCHGGLMGIAFDYIKRNQGINTEESYPYVGEQGACKYKQEADNIAVTGHVFIPTEDEEKLKSAIATVGPISIAIDASHLQFQFYRSGVYYEPFCSTHKLNHAVLAVGYGIDDETKEEYYLVKNSWGKRWGDEGYIKMARNKNNNCGIATYAVYPLV